ncbi:MAG: hypothetical protein ACU4F9_07840 [Arcticibacter sp.]
MTYFDDKQKNLINSWHNLSEQSLDPYMAFMAEWIAFNAICYNLYYENAIIERANIDRSKSKLKKIHEKFNPKADLIVQEAKLVGTIEKWAIDLMLPERLFISVSNNYTEDIIFNEFVKENQKWYDKNPIELFDNLKTSLSKGSRNFVINMARSRNYDEKIDIDLLASKNIIILCEENNLKTIKNVLYQIRCNIFHGEKIPGDINDDRIVKSSLPLLKHIVEYLLDIHKIK